MAQVTNPSNDSYDVPSLGLHFEPGETITVDDADTLALSWPFVVNGQPAEQQASHRPADAPAPEAAADTPAVAPEAAVAPVAPEPAAAPAAPVNESVVAQ